MIWKQVFNFPNYEVSEEGQLRNKTTLVIFNGWQDKDGYIKVTLRQHGIVKTWYLHRLVCEAFNGQCQEGMCVDHINTTRTDNRIANLRYISTTENSRQGGYFHKGKPKSEQTKAKISAAQLGIKHSICYLTEEAVKDIRRSRLFGIPISDLVKKYNVSRSTISMAATGRNWKHI